MYLQMGIAITTEDARYQFEAIDKDKSGNINYEEFRYMIQKKFEEDLALNKNVK